MINLLRNFVYSKYSSRTSCGVQQAMPYLWWKYHHWI